MYIGLDCVPSGIAFDPHNVQKFSSIHKNNTICFDNNITQVGVWGYQGLTHKASGIRCMTYDSQRKNRIFWVTKDRIFVFDRDEDRDSPQFKFTMMRNDDLFEDAYAIRCGVRSIIVTCNKLEFRLNLCEPMKNIRKFVFMRDDQEHEKEVDLLKAVLVLEELEFNDQFYKVGARNISPEEYAHFLLLHDNLQDKYKDNIKIRKKTDSERINPYSMRD